MTLPASGSISMNAVNLELGLAGNTQISFGQAGVRQMIGKSTGAVVLSTDFYNKSAGVISPIPTLQGTTFFAENLGGSSVLQLAFLSDGTWELTGGGLSYDTSSGSWYIPTTTSVGSSYWIKFTRTGGFGGSAPSGWVSLSSNQSATVFSSSGVITATYTIQISTNSSGTAIVSTTTGVELYCSTEAV